MQLTGKQIEQSGVITGVCPEGVQQQGIDVRVSRILWLKNTGKVPAVGKTIKPESYPCVTDGGFYHLEPGYYEIEFIEGCNIPNNQVLNFKTRSSLVRCGAEVLSGQFDAGFHTDHMGAFLRVNIPIDIEESARVAQAIITESYPVDSDNLYNGQWQGDKQRQETGHYPTGDEIQYLLNQYHQTEKEFQHEVELLILADRKLSAIKALDDRLHCGLCAARCMMVHLIPDGQ